MGELERLLNILCEKGWKPRGFKLHGLSLLKHEVLLYLPDRVSCYRKLRELVSVESGLWQYVCKNKMIKSENGVWVKGVDGMYKEILINQFDYEYRLIESTLKDESELEKFLLSNIVIKDE